MGPVAWPVYGAVAVAAATAIIGTPGAWRSAVAVVSHLPTIAKFSM
jgi:hypothetical protein